MSMDKEPRDIRPLEEAITAYILKSEVLAWAKKIGVEPKEIHIRSMKKKWASCSSNGRLTIDKELLRTPAEFRRKVIVHELVHLKVPNHGKLFNSLVRAYLKKDYDLSHVSDKS